MDLAETSGDRGHLEWGGSSGDKVDLELSWTSRDENNLSHFLIMIHTGQVQLTLSSGGVGGASFHALVLHEHTNWDGRCFWLKHLVRLFIRLGLRDDDWIRRYD